VFDFISYPMANLILFLYNLLGQSTVAAISVLTLLINLLILPLTLQQQKSTRKMQEFQPQIEKLQKKYANDKERLSQEQMKLYQEAGINPMAGCLPLLIQMPIWFGLIAAIRYCIPTTPLEVFQFSQHIYKWFVGTVPLQSTFLGMDLGLPPGPSQPLAYALPVLVLVTSWLQQKLLTPPTPAASGSSSDPPQASASAQQMKMMQTMMPLMMMMFTLQYSTGLSIYFIISSVIRIVQYYFVQRRQNDEPGGTKRLAEPKKQKS